MLTIGLTGGIAAGKSTVAAQAQALGAKLCSADALVHRLMQPNGAAYPAIARIFPAACVDGKVDRNILGSLVFENTQALAELEAILHPLVIREEKKFIDRQRRLGARICMLEIPLLFETKGEHRFDYVLVVTAPKFLQHMRALKRPHMTKNKLDSILARQLSHAMRIRKADFVVQTGLGKAYSFAQVKSIIQGLPDA